MANIEAIMASSKRRQLLREAKEAFRDIMAADGEIAAYALRNGGRELISMQGDLVSTERWAEALADGDSFSPRNALVLSPNRIPKKLLQAAVAAREAFALFGGAGVRSKGPWTLAAGGRAPLATGAWPSSPATAITFSSAPAWRGAAQPYHRFREWVTAARAKAALDLKMEEDPDIRDRLRERVEKGKAALDLLAKLHRKHGDALTARWSSGAAIKLRASWGDTTSPYVAIGGLLVVRASADTAVARAPKRKRGSTWPALLVSVMGWDVYA